MKKIWICGSSGMLGSCLTRMLEKGKNSFFATDREKVDITNLESVSSFVRINKISHVLNCAAYTQVDQAETEQKQAYLINALGPHNLGVACRKFGAHILHFSTDYVFDGNSRIPYCEDHPCSPLGAYGMSKLAGEIKLLNEHPHACIIRTSWLFGDTGKNFVETMLRLMHEKEHLKVVADQVGRPTYCHDVAETALQLLEAEGIYHFANSTETSWHQFAKEIHRQSIELEFSLKVKMIEPIPSKDYPTKAQRPAYSTLNTKKIEELLGSAPRPWQKALSEYLIKVKQHSKTAQRA